MRAVVDGEAVMFGQPGDFCIDELTADDGRARLYIWAKLPGGGFCSLPIAINEKPAESPSWIWDGNGERPTLSPSVWHAPRTAATYEWHGFIRNGRMESC
jgi:hypothetical protein